MEAITISLDIYPPKGSHPATVNVGAAAGDGTPIFLTGTFAERHQLVDQAYGAALKQGAKAEARAAAKPKANGAASKGTKKSKGSAAPAFGQPGHLATASDAEPERVEESVAEETGPIGPEATDDETQTSPAEPAGDLPVIEGDDAQLELELEGENG